MSPLLRNPWLLTAVAVLVAAPARAQDQTPEIGERVALALSSAQSAQGRADNEELARALGIIERSGARPLDGWQGVDPVPEWRALVPNEKAPLRGSPLGPGYRTGKAQPGTSDSFEQVFLSGRKASIALSTPGDTPVTLQVLDAERRPVCTIADARRACRWIPLFTQRYVIEVRNGGNRAAEYFLVVE
ncbi:hypothetical protein QUC32_10315 [Novosphingobium resinovorum]|uniref:hypothetical protein n=1 Tax=Sphingomonadaceae TaxID=41297 RepID=UPI00027CC503|nr:MULTISPECIES: hypothetical protein [Sphingomonadaceae]EJU13034.1 hypothetical protein LH128_10681 [Sphingomonas sp. LH128]MBF7010060.1 hypothetical protein [Novosphingobium sp. HR1a]WJM28080.1 hypothetical protein QUC32_10315 [Novosphingobium resinovorum]